VSFFAVNLLFLRLPESRAGERDAISSIRLVGWGLLLAVVVGIVILVLLRLRAQVLISFLERKSRHLPQKLMRPVLNLLGHLAEGLSVLLDLRELVITILYTLAVWGLVGLSTWLVLLAFGLDFPVSYVIFVLGFGLVGSIVPTPGGSAGAFHAAAAAGLIFLGIERNRAASIALIFHLVAFGPPFLVGLYYLVRDGIGLQRLREIMAHEGLVDEIAAKAEPVH